MSPRDAAERSLSPLGRWVIEHDDSRVFVVAYIALAVLLSVFISLFWLVAVVAVHAALEWVRQRHYASRPGMVLSRVAWELKLDVALVLFALVIAVYMEVVLGAAGLGAGMRLGAQAATRFAGWERVIRGVLLSVDDLAQAARAAGARKNGHGDAGEDDGGPPAGLTAGWRGHWSVGDRIAIGLGLASLALLALGPVLTAHTVASMLSALAAELHPFPGAAG